MTTVAGLGVRRRARNDEPLMSERRKLPALFGSEIVGPLGLTPTPGEWHDYTVHSDRFDCAFEITPHFGIDQGHVWMPCRFNRPSPAKWEPGGPGLFADIHESMRANRYTGKHNCHIFARMSAQQIIYEWRTHILVATRSF